MAVSGAAKYALARPSAALLEQLIAERASESAIAHKRRQNELSEQKARLIGQMRADSQAKLAEIEAQRERLPQEVVDSLTTLGLECQGADSLEAMVSLRDTVGRLHAEWQSPQAAARPPEQPVQPRHAEPAALLEVRCRLDTLSGDPMVRAWCQADLQRLDEHYAEAVAACNGGDMARCRAMLGNIELIMEPLVAQAEERDFAETVRSRVVMGLLQVLQAQDFAVAAPDLVEPGNLASEVVIRAVRPDRRSLAVKIPVSGPLTYLVDGYRLRQETALGGDVICTCDEAEARLLALHGQLAADFAIETDALTWEGQDSDRQRRAANALPGSRPGNRTTGGP